MHAKKRRTPGSVIIKNMRGSKTVSTESIEMNEHGEAMSEDDSLMRRKFIDYTAVTFPEVNPIDLVLSDSKNGQVRL